MTYQVNNYATLPKTIPTRYRLSPEKQAFQSSRGIYIRPDIVSGQTTFLFLDKQAAMAIRSQFVHVAEDHKTYPVALGIMAAMACLALVASVILLFVNVHLGAAFGALGAIGVAISGHIADRIWQAPVQRG